MKETLLQFVVGVGGVVGIFLFGAIYRAVLGYDPPLGEVAIVTIGTIAGVRTAMTGYTDLQVRKVQATYGPPPRQ